MREKQKTLVIEFEDWNDSFIDYFETLFIFTQHQQSGSITGYTHWFVQMFKKEIQIILKTH